MKRILGLSLILLIVYSCAKRYSVDRSYGSTHKVIVSKDTTIPMELRKYDLSKINRYADADTVFYPLGNNYIDGADSIRMMAIGKFIDHQNIYALDISVPDSLIEFYHYNNRKWKKIGAEKINIWIYSVEFEDLDGDGKNEIITSTPPNMNGNKWNEVYYCSRLADTIKYAGNFVTDYTIQKEDRTIQTVYEGSWYMPLGKTLYQWRNEKLVPLKSAVLSLKKADMKHDGHFIDYYENPTYDRDTLVLRFRKTYRENNDKLYNLWEHFFDK